jgi:hypothetical protein
LTAFPGVEHWAEAFGELERERLRVNGRDLPRMCHQQLAEAILLSTRSSMKQASNS